MSVTFDAERHCGAKTRNPAQPQCRMVKGFRTDHVGAGNCYRHGGNTPNGRKHGQRENAAKSLAALAVPIEGDPLEVLQAAVESAYGVMLAARELLASEADTTKAELYFAAIERASRVARGAAEAVNEERLTKLKEREADVYERALMRAAERFGIRPADRPRFLEFVREELVVGLQEFTH